MIYNLKVLTICGWYENIYANPFYQRYEFPATWFGSISAYKMACLWVPLNMFLFNLTGLNLIIVLSIL